jgi:glycine hydroxymethyltransferase
MSFFKRLSKQDPEIAKAIKQELERQRHTLELIASENFVSLAVLAAEGTILTNKYAEGYPGNRYYGGCQFVDIIENLARDRAKELFGAEYANVQPHAGSQANTAAYYVLIQPGDPVLALDLAHGGHLTHGSKANLSGRLYDFVHYGVNKDTELLDYDEILKLAKKHRPKLIVTGASAYPRVIDFAAFRRIADEVEAGLMVDMAHIAGLVAAGIHPSPVPYSEVVTTTTHKTLRGPRSGLILCRKELGASIDKAIFPGTQGGPLVHAIASKAVCFKEAMTEEFRRYQEQIVKNAQALAAGVQKAGFRLVAGGTDNHLFLVDLTSKGITGLDAQTTLEEVGIIVNKNTIPFETKGPVVTSGIRVGTPAVTTRGMKEPEMGKIAELISKTLEHLHHGRDGVIREVKAEVKKLCEEFPLYPDIEKEM